MTFSAFESEKNPALFILEAGVNHEGQIEKAFELIREASACGADFVKFQTYTAEKLAAKHSPSYWNLQEEPISSQIELFSKFDGFSKTDYFNLADYAKSLGIGFLTTCFDEDWVDDLDPILPLYKIASADLTNFSLVSHIAGKKKPIILSTGASSFTEISHTLELIRSISNQPVCLMHCVLNYPTEFTNANLDRILNLSKEFPDVTIGYSDHTRPEFSKIAIQTAFSLGARVFEKHFTTDKSMRGNDHYHSFDYRDCNELLTSLKTLSSMKAFSESNFLMIQSDARSFARRGLYAKQGLKKGDTIRQSDLIPLRPRFEPDGIPSEELFNILGQELTEDLAAGEAITIRHFI